MRVTGISVRFLLVAGLLAKTIASPQTGMTAHDAAVIEEVHHLWSVEASRIWPGASRTEVPLLYIKSDTEYAIGFPEKIKGFALVLTSGQEPRSIQARARTLATDLSASFPIGGMPAVVIGSPELLNKSVEDWVLVAAHEMFHVCQAANGSYTKISTLKISSSENPSWQLTFPFPYADADVMRLIHLQGYNLWLAATSKGKDEAQYDVGTAVEAAQVYQAFLGRTAQAMREPTV